MALFLTAVVLFPAAAVNGWPFSNWRLFSVLRTAQATGWQAVAVDAAGQERNYPLASARHGYRGFGSVMSGFSKRSRRGRDAICRAWAQEATRQFGPGTARVRIYRLRWLVSERRNRGAVPPRPSLAWSCGPEGAHAGD